MKHQLKNRFLEFVLEKNLFQPDSKVLVAVSGGVDSMVLLDLLCACRRRLQIRLGVVHLHHGIRAVSAQADLKLVEETCQARELPLQIFRRSVPRFARQHRRSVEEAGHLLREKLFGDYAAKHGYQTIATGHHADDQAETVLMRLLTGTGLQGLAAIRLHRQLWVRPLLFASRADIEAYARQRNIPFRIDETNQDLTILRNKIRHQLLPLLVREYNAQAPLHLARLSQLAGEWEEYLQKQADQAYREQVIRESENKFEVGIAVFKFYFSAILIRLVEKIVCELGKKPCQVSFQQFSHFLNWVNKGKTGSEYQWNETVSAFKKRDRIILVAGTVSETVARTIQIHPGQRYLLPGAGIKISVREAAGEKVCFSPDHQIEYISGENIEFPLRARHWQSGDRFVPLGFAHSRKVSDFLTDAKVGQPEKRSVYVLLNQKEIVAILGFQISEKYRISKNSRKIYQIKLETGSNERRQN